MKSRFFSIQIKKLLPVVVLLGVQLPYRAPADTFSTALGTSNVVWSTSGDTPWFVQTTNTPGSAMAAQSGSVTNYQTSTLSGTIYGPGALSYYWASQDVQLNFDFEFDIDGNYESDLYGNNSWGINGSFNIPGGQHTLSFTVYSNGDTDPTEAGFLAQVSYVQTIPTRVILTNTAVLGTNLTFSFLSQAGFTNTVQYSTNVLGGWQAYTNIYGDGTVMKASVPLSTFAPAKTGFVRIHP